ncbi:uncharacterized protein LOC133303476 [Gastrolobium bilobum]|uniref:uncharacterized protein LOC133303476 n=1 Tax=Gastrolobium bilobum TaxID=150636 RepID=UPI002AB0068F|nr:uncharacterized protein LOC133303476 [Gastrolobium bilobum]XP_061359382.1 uncharacterized protein LOC133303476 [Gastrolobium bilobum]
MEEQPTALQVESETEFNDEIWEVTDESSCAEARISCIPHAETATSSDTRTEFSGNNTVEGCCRNVATSRQRPYLSECKELVPPSHVSADHSPHGFYRDSSNIASTSFVEQMSSNLVSDNVSVNKDAVINIGNSVDSGDSQISHETMHQEHGNSRSSEISIENHSSAFIAIQSSVSRPVTDISNLPVTSQLREDEPSQETTPSSSGFLVSSHETGQGNQSVLPVDVIAISSNILSDSTAGDSDQDARRNGRRLFWDAFLRHSSRRFGDSPTIVLSASNAEDLGSQEQLLVNLGVDFPNDGVGGDSRHLGNRINRFNEQRQNSRSEIWERLHGGLDGIGRSNSSCPLGLHADGVCSCESFAMDEESSIRARVSRIVMLAEALFEFLEEIHRQPLSLYLSMVSLPAPESIVDSLPLKSHKKVDAHGNTDAEQCYICLDEYEEGEQIRLLPCNHEYHMSCVDKWLKEIHGVCPLCRGNVCSGYSESSASDTEVSSR